MTVLQLASIYQTIANDGVRVSAAHRPVGHRPGRLDLDLGSSRGSGGRARRTAKTVRTMLESVTQPGGTGVKAAIPGYRWQARPGPPSSPTRHTAAPTASWMNWDTFAGMAPADDPQFVVAIMVDNPAHGLEGGDVAAPLFNEIASYELQHAHIPPTGSLSKHVPLLVCSVQDRSLYGSTVC